MPRKLFITVDPVSLDGYSSKYSRVLSRKRSRTVKEQLRLDLFRRALVSLPPRELYILFAVTALGHKQAEVAELFRVRQSNVSFRRERAERRLEAFQAMRAVISETRFRRVLIDVGVPAAALPTVLGVFATTSQRATAEALKLTCHQVRHHFEGAREALEKSIEKAGASAPADHLAARKLFGLLEKYRKQLTPLTTQARWRDRFVLGKNKA